MASERLHWFTLKRKLYASVMATPGNTCSLLSKNEPSVCISVFFQTGRMVLQQSGCLKGWKIKKTSPFVIMCTSSSPYMFTLLVWKRVMQKQRKKKKQNRARERYRRKKRICKMGVEPRPLKSATEPWQKQPNLGVVFRPFLYTSCQGCLRGKESLGCYADITQARGYQKQGRAGHVNLHECWRNYIGPLFIRLHTCCLFQTTLEEVRDS